MMRERKSKGEGATIERIKSELLLLETLAEEGEERGGAGRQEKRSARSTRDKYTTKEHSAYPSSL